MTRRAGFKLLIGLLVACAGVAAAGDTRAQLLIVPQRVVLEDRERTATVNVVNQTDQTTTYRIAWRELRQTEDGSYAPLEDPPADARLASPFVRYSPRQVTLAPGEQQVVRLLARRPGGLEDGEYRSHMLFAAEPVTLGQEAQTEEGIGVQLQVVYGVTIPVIVRIGELEATAGLADLRATDAPAADAAEDEAEDDAESEASEAVRLSFAITRSGARSVYGDIEVLHRRPGPSEPRILASVRGLAVYPPNTRRTVQLDVPVPQDLDLAGQPVEVVYRQAEDQGGDVLASQTLTLPD